MLYWIPIAIIVAAPPAEGYVGLRLRDLQNGYTVISRILPGPMEGEGITCQKHDVARPDLLVAVDGIAMNADAFSAYVRSRSPGETMIIDYRRSNRRGGAIPETLDHEDESRQITIEVGRHDAWTGTIHVGRGHDLEVRFTEPWLLDPLDANNVLGAAIHGAELAAPLKRLTGVFEQWQQKAPDFHSLSRVRAPFFSPFCMPQLGDIMTAPTAGVPQDPFGTPLGMIADNLDVPRPLARPITPVPGIGGARDAFLTAAEEASVALGAHAGDKAFARNALAMLRVPGETFYLEGASTTEHAQVIRASMDVDFRRLLESMHRLDPFTRLNKADLPTATIAPPESLQGVTGELLHAENLGAGIGWMVVGGAGANEYDMTHVALVIDVGGDDVYSASDLRLGVRCIVDFAGDDVYTGTAEQGPGGALLGVSLIDDRSGNDQYTGQLLSAGAACYGMSLLLDRAGNDVYVGTQWSQGAACYGAGVIVDLGSGGDTYLGEFLCQGVGGPRGFGCIVDQNGRDLYRAVDPAGSVYGTPAVFRSFSQGMGFGYRHYAAGGIGMISDLGGDDRYEAGEFAQGGAYYFGLGVLHDASGRDLYYGNRYGQGFGVHQAHGMLIDDAGDDTYWSMTAASQGAGWDIGVGMLLDRAGNDTYQCDALGQGGAAQQAIGMLIDLGGTDRYVAGGGATQGQSGGNAYHHGQTGAFSFSLLIDEGGAEDLYSHGRANNATAATGALNNDDPASSGLHGLVIDR